MPKTDYEERQAEKKERYEELAAKNRLKSDSGLKEARKMADIIPFGQPILIGHHSEKRDRNYRDRISRKYEKSFEDSKKADYYENKVNTIEKNYAISQDDPEAIRKLKEKLQGIEKDIQQIKEHNKKPKAIVLGCFSYREGYQSISNTNGNYKQFAKILEGKLIFEEHTRFPKGVKERIENYMKTKSFNNPDITKESKRLPAYHLENLNGNKSRIKKRIDELHALDKVKDEEWTNNKITVQVNKDENRIMILFPGKPEEEIRSKLKHHGFRWSPRNMAWQSYINQWNLDLAKEFLK